MWPRQKMFHLCWVDYNQSVSTLPAEVIETEQPYFLQSYQLNTLKSLDGIDGHQNPAIPGLQEICQMYNRYKIMGVKMTWTFTNRTTEPCYVGLWMSPEVPSTAVSGDATWAQIDRMFDGNPNTISASIGSSSGGNNVKKLSMYRSFYKLIGNKEEFLGDGDYSATAAVTISGSAITQNCDDPLAAVYGGYCMWANLDDTSKTPSLAIRPKFQFYIKFYSTNLEVA